ncbi:MAG TPA: hypothetical protein VKK19_07020 [Candidatus Dormibacteraeota bacterium]|nr:hypothetical protein [Candidatus Dormibacteraeota bacterium]
MATSGSAAKTKANGPGTITDALTGFGAQAAKIPAGPAPDAVITVAYALGWALGEALTCVEYGNAGHLAQAPPGLDDEAERWKILINQIISRCRQLHTHLKDAGAGLDLSDQLKDSAGLYLDPPPKQDSVKAAIHAKKESVEKLHTGTLGALWSVEQPLGKAYLLGYEMEQMCTTPAVDKGAKVKASVEGHFARVHLLLIALASKLPSNAAHATDNSLRLWRASLRVRDDESPEDLLRQGWRWREVLAGDVAGKDGLRLSDYIAAADSVTGKLRSTAQQVAKRFWVWLVIVLAIAALGIGLIAWGAKGALGAGIASVIAAFGLTWKGVGEFFGRVAAKGEAELWDAEIDWAIAHRFTTLRNYPNKKQIKQSRALQDDQPIQEHLQRHKYWKDKWPDTLTPKPN